MEMCQTNEASDETKEDQPVIKNKSDASEIASNGLCCDSSFCKIETNLLKYKSFYFWFAGAIGSLFPYLAVYFKQLGFSPKEIGIISGCRPIIGFCSGPIWGSLADRFRVRKLMLCLSTLGWLAIITSLGLIPAATSSDAQCDLVHEFIGAISNTSINTSSTPITSDLRDEFDREHRLRPHSTAEESLFESRGWMMDSAELRRLFAIIVTLVAFGELLQSPAGALADSGCIEALEDDGMRSYGHQRAWGSIGHGVFALLSGLVLSSTRYDILACGITVTIANYRVAFYFFTGCMTCCFLSTLAFKFKKQADDRASAKPRPNPLKVFRMFLTLHFGSWLLCMYFTGICNGVIWSFLFWQLENIGATQLLLGVAQGISLVSETLTFFLVFRLIDRFGCSVLMAVGLLGYTVRFTVFALIDNPWLVLPFEVLQGATFAGVWSVYIKYFSSSVPSEYLGTLQGFVHGVYWGLGTGTGSMLGGVLVQHYGARVTFWIFSVASFVNMLAFVIIQKVTVRPRIFNTYEELDADKR